MQNSDVYYAPSYSVFDSDSSGPTLPQDYAAHSVKQNGVCKIHDGRLEHHRHIDNCSKILTQVENKIYFET